MLLLDGRAQPRSCVQTDNPNLEGENWKNKQKEKKKKTEKQKNQKFK